MTVDPHADVPLPPRVWFLTAEEVAATRAKLAALLARASRKGFNGRLELDAAPATRSSTSPGGLVVTEHGFDVTITGDPPHYEGWRFVAAVDSVDGGAVLRYPPGAQASVANDQVRAGECDHCHTHRDRRSTILVAHETGGVVLQVGRSCLKDFLGHSTMPVLLTLDDVAGALGAKASAQPTAWDTLSVLTYAQAAVEAFGWTPASASGPGRTPTRDVVRLALCGGGGADDVRKALAPHLHEATARAPQLRGTLLERLTGTTGYEANLIGVLRADSVTARHLGLAVSAVTAHARLTHELDTNATAAAAPAPSEWLGAIGDRVTVTGTVRTALRVDGYSRHSPDPLMLILECPGAVVKMTTAAGWSDGVKRGDTVTVTATVKAHTEWNGTRQTVLTRPKPAPHLPDPADWERPTAPRRERPEHRTPCRLTPSVASGPTP